MNKDNEIPCLLPSISRRTTQCYLQPVTVLVSANGLQERELYLFI